MSPHPPQSFDAITPELAEAVRIANRRLVEHVSPDTCERCSGHGCDQCRDCPCPRNACKRKRRGR